MSTYKDDQKIFKIIARVDKKDSVFFYFTLESNENLCFYSTLQESLPTQYRDIMIRGAIELKDNVYRILDHLRESMSIEILTDEIIKDI